MTIRPRWPMRIVHNLTRKPVQYTDESTWVKMVVHAFNTNQLPQRHALSPGQCQDIVHRLCDGRDDRDTGCRPPQVEIIERCSGVGAQDVQIDGVAQLCGLAWRE